MSKSGVYAHFGSKQELQLATVDEAGQIFHGEVVEPALVATPGLAQLVTVCDAFFDRLRGPDVPGRLLLRRSRPRGRARARSGQGGARRLPEQFHHADPPVRGRCAPSGTSSPRRGPEPRSPSTEPHHPRRQCQLRPPGPIRPRWSWQRRRRPAATRRRTLPSARRGRMTTVEEALAAWGTYDHDEPFSLFAEVRATDQRFRR